MNHTLRIASQHMIPLYSAMFLSVRLSVCLSVSHSSLSFIVHACLCSKAPRHAGIYLEGMILGLCHARW